MEGLRTISTYSKADDGSYKHSVTFLTGEDVKLMLDKCRETTTNFARDCAKKGEKISDIRVTNKHGACSCVTLWNRITDDSGSLAIDGEGFTTVDIRRNYSIDDVEEYMPFTLLGIGSFKIKSDTVHKTIQGLIVKHDVDEDSKVSFVKLCENNAHIHNLIESIEKVLPDSLNIFELFTKYIKIHKGVVSIIDA